VIPVDLERQPRLTEGIVQLALADYLEWWRVVCVPNLCLWHEMDLAVLTRAGCLWEFEIKLNQADWERDREKDEPEPIPPWVATLPAEMQKGYGRPRRNLTHVERFHYVYPPKLTVPAWVPEWAGLLTVDHITVHGRVFVQVLTHRGATARKAPKPDERHRRKFYEAIYHRYWRHVRNLEPPEQEQEMQALSEGAA
jgi:hypothetical protein